MAPETPSGPRAKTQHRSFQGTGGGWSEARRRPRVTRRPGGPHAPSGAWTVPRGPHSGPEQPRRASPCRSPSDTLPPHPEQPTDDSVGNVGPSTSGATRERRSKTQDDTTMHPRNGPNPGHRRRGGGEGAPHATRASTVTLDSSPGSSTPARTGL